MKDDRSLGEILDEEMAKPPKEPAILWRNVPAMIGTILLMLVTFWVVKNTVGPAIDWLRSVTTG